MCENAGRQASTVNRFMRPEARLPAEEMTTLISQAHINVHGVTDLAGHWLGTGMYLGGAMFNHRYVVCICLFGRTFVNQRASSPHPWIDNRRPTTSTRQIIRRSVLRASSPHIRSSSFFP